MQTFKTIFTYVDKDVDDDVKDVVSKVVKDAFNVELKDNFKNYFVKIDRFVKIVSMHIIANINILITNNFVNDIKDTSMLIIKKKKHVKVIIDDFVKVVEDVFNARFKTIALLRQFYNCCVFCL